MSAKLHAHLILLIALTTAAGAQQPAQKGRTWAVIIGVSKYQKLPGGQQLQFADHDAASVAEALEKRGVSPSNVRLLIGAEATTAAIKSAIGNWLAKSAPESDTIIIYFSGHGFFERDFGESYLLGYDSDPRDVYDSALSVTEVGRALAQRVRSNHVLLIADAVRKDFFDPESDPTSARSFEQAFDQITASRSGLSAIIASGPGEFSREGQRWGGHGAFTKHLVDALNAGVDRNGDGTITADELFDSLTAKLEEDTSNKQHPWRSGSALAQIAVAHLEGQSPPSTTEVRSQAPSKPPSPAVIDKTGSAEARKSEKSYSETAPKPTLTKPAETQVDIAVHSSNDTKVEPVAAEKMNVERKVESPAATGRDKSLYSTSTGARAKSTSDVADGKLPAASINAGSSTQPAPAGPQASHPTRPPGIEAINTTQPAATTGELRRSEVAVANIPPPPKPSVNPPSSVVLSPEPALHQPEALSANVPASRVEAAPSPLVLQLEVAIASSHLIEPKNNCAWDFYQQLTSDPGAAPDLARLKPKLAQALAGQGRIIVGGDVRSDNISEKVDDFKRAGQLLARARSLSPENSEAMALEKLSAAEALISLQFFDEADRALAPLQSAKLAPVENALGLVYQGRLDTWQAERAFKRAIDLDSKWAAPHYNLALLYRTQQNQAALVELETAVALDQGNISMAAALGEEYFTRQQWKQAADAFRRAVALKPSDDNLHTKLGHALYSQGLQEEANREYQKARELRGKQP